MKCSELWLREWVDPHLTREALCNMLTMAGLEVEELSPVAAVFSGVVVGEIKHIEVHPEKKSLHVCQIDVGTDVLLNIVCGANNIKRQMKVPVATVNAVLPNAHEAVLQATIIHGIVSQGMLCSAEELGLVEDCAGLLELPTDAPVGQNLRTYLMLDDYTIDVSITPNRGDCLSIRGMAREISALTKKPFIKPSIPVIAPSIQDELPLTLHEEKACPIYVGRIIRHLHTDKTSPMWLKERLRRSGIRSIHPVVDVTNYVMLELGQPMHAFDLHTIKQAVHVRYSKMGEQIILLDGSTQILNDETLVIADQQKPLAIAGVMGGLHSSVTSTTNAILLESAYFSSMIVAKSRQSYHLNSDSAYRFERGIDHTIQCEAMERATQLILEIVGGESGPLITRSATQFITSTKAPIVLPHNKIKQILGFSIEDKAIAAIFDALQFSYQYKNQEWYVNVPPYRTDLSLSEDLIEEIARLYGYDHIPTHQMKAILQVNTSINSTQKVSNLRQAFICQGYHEIISYSFVDKQWQALLDPGNSPKELLNPITTDMSVMRTNLWPGLLKALLYNQSRQQYRICLFELGACFVTRKNALCQESKLAGLMTGLAYPEQWGVTPRDVDFYDVKGHIENVLNQLGLTNTYYFQPGTHLALHPGQTADIYLQESKIGVLGTLHPKIVKTLNLSGKIILFELNLPFSEKNVYHYQAISKFPEIRRDIAIIINETVPAKDIQDTIKRVTSYWLKEVFIFDVYQGKGVSPGLKSVALALILQHPARTLIDAEVAELMERIINALKDQLGAVLRS